MRIGVQILITHINALWPACNPSAWEVETGCPEASWLARLARWVSFEPKGEMLSQCVRWWVHPGRHQMLTSDFYMYVCTHTPKHEYT